AFVRAGARDLEGALHVLRVMLVELRELEPDLWVVDAGGQALEVGERPRLIAAGLGDLGARAGAFLDRAFLDRGACNELCEVFLPRALQRSRNTDEIRRFEL